MNQLVIEYNYLGQWSRKYGGMPYREYKTLTIPRALWNTYKVIGVTVDNREKWRQKKDSITQHATYDIIVKGDDI
jgi:hypothetical protein